VELPKAQIALRCYLAVARWCDYDPTAHPPAITNSTKLKDLRNEAPSSPPALLPEVNSLFPSIQPPISAMQWSQAAIVTFGDVKGFVRGKKP
jgi:hypothetical protein